MLGYPGDYKVITEILVEYFITRNIEKLNLKELRLLMIQRVKREVPPSLIGLLLSHMEIFARRDTKNNLYILRDFEHLREIESKFLKQGV